MILIGGAQDTHINDDGSESAAGGQVTKLSSSLNAQGCNVSGHGKDLYNDLDTGLSLSDRSTIKSADAFNQLGAKALASRRPTRKQGRHGNRLGVNLWHGFKLELGLGSGRKPGATQ